MEFYSTALHEMAHSTGSPERLNREGGKKFGDKKYAKEELVAELTAATVSQQLGFDKHVTDNSAMYLSNWVKALKEEPKFIYTVLSEVGKAQGLIMEEIEKQSQHLTKKLPEATSAMEMLSQTAIKAKIEYPDTLILVRHGQNYELYNKDAEIASKVLGISTAQHLQKGTENGQECLYLLGLSQYLNKDYFLHILHLPHDNQCPFHQIFPVPVPETPT